MTVAAVIGFEIVEIFLGEVRWYRALCALIWGQSFFISFFIFHFILEKKLTKRLCAFCLATMLVTALPHILGCFLTYGSWACLAVSAAMIIFLTVDLRKAKRNEK